jgi:uncharacterized protein (DUF433 family)
LREESKWSILGIMNAQKLSWKYLAPKAGSHYRQLFVDGTRIAARVLYSYYTPGEDWPGQMAEEIAAGFNLPVEAVREAIAYCETDPPEIHEDWEKEEALANAAKTKTRDSNLQAEDYARIFLR